MTGARKMTMAEPLHPVPAPVLACTVSRDVQNFDLLIAGMEDALGESWGDLSFPGALAFLAQPEAGMLEFLVVALDDQDGHDPGPIAEVIRAAGHRAIRVILVATEGGAGVAGQLAGLGVQAALPYPLPDGALHEAIDRIRSPIPGQPAQVSLGTNGPVLVADPPPVPAAAVIAPDPDEVVWAAAGGSDPPQLAGPGGRRGVVLPVHALAGGLGATTFATTLAWELALLSPDAPNVCLIDLDLQYGSVATCLDLARKAQVTAFLADLEQAGAGAFLQALQPVRGRLQVLTAPPAMLPVDLISAAGMARLLDLAQDHFDFIVIDMPRAVTGLTETVLSRAGGYFALLGADLRSAQNLQRFGQALRDEGLALDGLRYVLARASGLGDPAGRARARRIAESLGISFDLQLPDGGGQVTQANDRGLPLAEAFPRNPLRKEVQKFARSLADARKSVAIGG